MSAALLSDRIVQEHAAASGALSSSSSVVSAERRRAALDALTAKGLPTTRDENWKYANLRPLERVKFAPASPALLATRPNISASDLRPQVAGYARYVFVDGAFAADLSATGSPDGVTVSAAGAPP